MFLFGKMEKKTPLTHILNLLPLSFIFIVMIFLTVTQLEEAKIPGIYILYADNKIYIGQAANNVISRIRQHDKNKSWWNNVVIFGREDSQLDKSQLDYMERTLIERFVSAGYDVDNNNEGNKSVIFTYQKGISQALLSSVNDILQYFLGMTIKPQKKLRNSVNNAIRKHSIGTTIENNTGLKIHEKSVKQAYNSYVSEVLKNMTPIIKYFLKYNQIPHGLSQKKR